jgi:hypothetical protein
VVTGRLPDGDGPSQEHSVGDIEKSSELGLDVVVHAGERASVAEGAGG